MFDLVYCLPQSLNYFSLCMYMLWNLEDSVWVGITCNYCATHYLMHAAVATFRRFKGCDPDCSSVGLVYEQTRFLLNKYNLSEEIILDHLKQSQRVLCVLCGRYRVCCSCEVLDEHVHHAMIEKLLIRLIIAFKLDWCVASSEFAALDSLILGQASVQQWA